MSALAGGGVDVVVFDLDDTLYLERDYVRSGFQAVGAWLLERGAPGFFDVAWRLFERGIRGTIFDRALGQVGLPATPERVAELVQVYRDHTPTLTLADDVDRVFHELRQGGRRLALLTDGYLEVQRRKVAALALEPRLDTAVFSDAFGRENWKPSPVPYEAVMQSLGCAPDRCVYVGDNPRKDFTSPRRLGWGAVRLVRDGGEHANAPDDPASPPHHTIRTLLELLPLFHPRA